VAERTGACNRYPGRYFLQVLSFAEWHTEPVALNQYQRVLAGLHGVTSSSVAFGAGLQLKNMR
jgi:hypothetical protein